MLQRTRCLNKAVGKVFAASYDHFFSQTSGLRQPSPIRSLMPLLKTPGMISLGGGLPNPDVFPFENLSFTVQGQQVSLTRQELEEALQYSPSPGLPGLLKELRALQDREHCPPYMGYDIQVTTGSQDGLTKAFEMFLNRGDPILVEDPTYPGTLAFLQPYGAQLLGVKTDGYGIIPEHLEEILESKLAKKPKVLYTIPTGQNPSGSTLPLKRKQQIYQLACKHDLIIMEDDPYYFLYYGSAPAPAAGQEHLYSRPKTVSFMSMDIEGRVLRFDSLSKILSSGLRIGWVTGPKPLIQRLELHQQATSLNASGVSQALAYKLMQHWGPAGWEKHLNEVALFYLRRRDVLIASAQRHLNKLAEWTVPDAGMFLWLKLLGIEDTRDLISSKAVQAKVLFIPGQVCSPSNAKSPFVRAAFSTASHADMDTAMQRLAQLLKSHQN